MTFIIDAPSSLALQPSEGVALPSFYSTSRHSSVVEQLIRNEQVLGSSPSGGPLSFFTKKSMRAKNLTIAGILIAWISAIVGFDVFSAMSIPTMSLTNLSARNLSAGMLLGLLLVLFVGPAASAQSLWNGIDFSGVGRSHRFDVVHIDIDIAVHDTLKEVSGVVRHRIRSLGVPLREITLDAAAETSIRSVVVDGVGAIYHLTGEQLAIELPKPVAYGDTFTVAIDYRVAPKTGLWFIAPDSLDPNQRRQVWTQGEGVENHGWVPLYDYPNDRASSETRIRVRGDWKVLSNGLLHSVVRNADSTVTWHWIQEEPHASYLIMFAAGDYQITRDTIDRIPLEYWTYPEMSDRISTTFTRTGDIIRYFTDLTGVPYPWRKYAQIMIAKFMYGGMENTGATTLNDRYLVDSRMILDRNPDDVISHELAHQWYGDLVTNRTWAHLWLHESFATYLSARYMGHRYGEEAFEQEMYKDGAIALRQERRRGRSAIVGGDGSANTIYSRGARVIHMLNQLVGEELFWRANNRFLQRNAFGLVDTDDLRIALEETTGLDLQWFFDQWLVRAGTPKLQVETSWDSTTIRLHVRQTQTRDSLTGLFRMYVPLEFHLRDTIITQTIVVDKEDSTYTFPLQEQPRFTIFDAGDVILKDLHFTRTDEELIAQLRAPRSVDRILAVNALVAVDTAHDDRKGWMRRSDAIGSMWEGEQSAWVRSEMLDNATDLFPEVAAFLVARGLQDTAVEVRRSAIENVYSITDKLRRAELVRPLLGDSSYSIAGQALVALAYSDTTGLEPILRAAKSSTSRGDRAARSWLTAVMGGGFGSLADSVVEFAGTAYNSDTRAIALIVLARLNLPTPGVISAIETGLRGPPLVVTQSAAAARTMMNPSMRDMLVRLRGELQEGARRDTVDKLINN